MSYRSDMEAAQAWKEQHDAVMARFREAAMTARVKADSDTMREQAFNALLYGLKLSQQAAPDLLAQLDIDRAARVLLEMFPIEGY